MNKTEYFNELYKLFGPVKRARNCFLYTKKGIRITDCFQENGRAILGWEGGSAFTHFKNVLSRGQVGSFITEDSSKLKKAVEKLLSSKRNIFFFSNKMQALKAGLEIAKDGTGIYAPWLKSNVKWEDCPALIITPPLPWTDSLYILAVKEELLSQENHFQNQIKIPFALQVAITRAIYNLIQAMQTREEKDWFIYDQVLTKYFERKGPYLYPKIPENKYDDFLLHCLKFGICFNPDFNEYSIVPYGADKGVFTSLKNSPFKY